MARDPYGNQPDPMGIGDFQSAIAAGAALGLDTANSGASYTMSSLIANTASGALRVTKLWAGTPLMAADNPYTGTTSSPAGTTSPDPA